jgi:hypothetical protein
MVQAQEFVKALSPGHPLVAPPPPSTLGDDARKGSKADSTDTLPEVQARDRYVSSCKEEAALEVIERYPIIAHEASEKYARALIEREMAVLMLGEAKLVADIDQGGREVRPMQ